MSISQSGVCAEKALLFAGFSCEFCAVDTVHYYFHKGAVVIALDCYTHSILLERHISSELLADSVRQKTWEEEHRLIHERISAMGSNIVSAEQEFFDCWSHLLISEINGDYHVACCVKSVLQKTMPQKVYMCVPPVVDAQHIVPRVLDCEKIPVEWIK